MVHRVPHQVHQRTADLLDHRPVQLGVLPFQDHLHPLAGPLGQVAHVPREPAEQVLDGEHAGFEDLRLQVARHPAQMTCSFRQLLRQPVGAIQLPQPLRDLLEPDAVHHQLAHEVHQPVQALHVHPDGAQGRPAGEFGVAGQLAPGLRAQVQPPLVPRLPRGHDPHGLHLGSGQQLLQRLWLPGPHARGELQLQLALGDGILRWGHLFHLRVLPEHPQQCQGPGCAHGTVLPQPHPHVHRVQPVLRAAHLPGLEALHQLVDVRAFAAVRHFLTERPQGVHALQQEVREPVRSAARPQGLQHLLHRVGQLRDPLEAQGARGALEGVGAAEQAGHQLGGRAVPLQLEDSFLQGLQVLVRLGEEDR
ncbi:hypothetical protein HRbin31_00256 [bacterium HR31]|nr:hypothetical protein HRbin31_00256 [bacterium HR31]